MQSPFKTSLFFYEFTQMSRHYSLHYIFRQAFYLLYKKLHVYCMFIRLLGFVELSYTSSGMSVEEP